MSSQFLFDKGVQEVVPYNAQFHFPSQATRTKKTTIKLPPKTAKNPYGLNDIIRFEFPASGYLNPLSVMWELDVWISTNATMNWRIQNNISSCINRAVIKYGSLVIEDIRNYGLLCRLLTEIGVGRDYYDSVGHLSNIGSSFTRANCLKGATSASQATRFLTPLLFGIFQQRKLVPLKWMSSQLIIELYISSTASEFLIADNVDAALVTQANRLAPSLTSFNISNTNLIYDIYEFDASYDEAFMEGLQTQGIPIQMTSWHNYTYPVSGTVVNAQIQERARSVKMAMACLTAASSNFVSDAHATFSMQSPALVTLNGNALSFVAGSGNDSAFNPLSFVSTVNSANPGLVTSYQFRIGGAYYPAQEVQVHTPNLLVDRNEGQEALFELQKALDTVGAYQTGTGFTNLTWCNSFQQSARNIAGGGGGAIVPNLFSHNRDMSEPCKAGVHSRYTSDVATTQVAANAITLAQIESANIGQHLDRRTGYQQSNPCAVFAVDLETSNGMEIAGINAEEQSDILLSMKFDPVSGTPGGSAAISQVQLNVYTSFDMLLVFRPNNQVEKIS